MFIHWAKRTHGDKTYKYPVLMENYRVGKKVRHKTIQNLSKWPLDVVKALERVFKTRKKGEKVVVTSDKDITVVNEASIGGIHVIKTLAKRLQIIYALGQSFYAMVVMLMISARLLYPSSKLANARWARTQAVKTMFDIEPSELDEQDLYKALDWLADNQEVIEKKLFRKRYSSDTSSQLYLYDVTSSYLEGKKNELSDYGYNRDGKTGKKQIVIGLLTNHNGDPVSVRVFQGNTGDTSSVPEQIRILGEQFNVKRVVFVGDKGMVRGPQIEQLQAADFNYISSITKQEIRSLLKHGPLQLELFSEDLADVEEEVTKPTREVNEHGDYVTKDKKVIERYILRRNPSRMEEIRQNRAERIDGIFSFARNQTSYLRGTDKRSPSVALRKTNEKLSRYNLKSVITAELGGEDGREVVVTLDRAALSKMEKLDGCYAIKTDLPKSIVSAQEIHDRYQDLSKVERAFRTLKSELEIRPVYHRLEKRTRGHVFMCMLSYLIEREFERKTYGISVSMKSLREESDRMEKKLTLKEKWSILDKLMLTRIEFGGHINRQIETPTGKAKDILSALGISMPKKIKETPL